MYLFNFSMFSRPCVCIHVYIFIYVYMPYTLSSRDTDRKGALHRRAASVQVLTLSFCCQKFHFCSKNTAPQ